jgi:hypothetical protein
MRQPIWTSMFFNKVLLLANLCTRALFSAIDSICIEIFCTFIFLYLMANLTILACSRTYTSTSNNKKYAYEIHIGKYSYFPQK